MEMRRDVTAWADLFPEGRTICYEGDEPDQFCAVIRNSYGL